MARRPSSAPASHVTTLNTTPPIITSLRSLGRGEPDLPKLIFGKLDVVNHRYRLRGRLRQYVAIGTDAIAKLTELFLAHLSRETVAGAEVHSHAEAPFSVRVDPRVEVRVGFPKFHDSTTTFSNFSSEFGASFCLQTRPRSS